MSEPKLPCLRTVIVEDEPIAMLQMKSMLQGCPSIELVGEARNGKQALDVIQDVQPDLVFLDIQMPVLTGFEVLKALQGDTLPLIVFTTAYEEYAVQAFDLHAVDYLLKPFSDERLNKALARVMERRQLAEEDQKGTLLQAVEYLLNKGDGPSVTAGAEPKLAIKESGEVLLIPQTEIDWVDAAGDYMCIHSKGQTHIQRCTMTQLLEKLDSRRFCRIHRSTVVNVDRITKVIPHTKGESFLMLDCGEKLKVSRNCREAIQQFLAS